MLIDQTQNFYGLKAALADAEEFLSAVVHATPGSFYDWMTRQQTSSL